MTFLTIVLALALLAALGYALWLLRRLHSVSVATQAPPEPFSPLFRAVTASLDAGLVVLDQERQVHYLNPQAEELLGVESELALGQGFITLIRDYRADMLVSEVLGDGEPREMVLQPVMAARMLRLRAVPLAANDITGVVLLIRDVTQLNMLERARRDMVANVSHELRTPLASVKLLVETLQSEPPAAIAQRMLGQMSQEVDAITQLVDELHELSQIESGRVALQLVPAALQPVTQRALERIRPQAERKSLHVAAQVSDQLPLALIDAGRIGQVLLNLLYNAVKFTPSGGQITIRGFVITIGPEAHNVGYVDQRFNTEALPDGATMRRSPASAASRGAGPAIQLPAALSPGDWILITVSDTGIGIPKQELPRIFERFYKVDRARTRNAGGTGLGLAIAKHLVEGHGGRIWAASEEGAGSTFFFVLPTA